MGVQVSARGAKRVGRVVQAAGSGPVEMRRGAVHVAVSAGIVEVLRTVTEAVGTGRETVTVFVVSDPDDDASFELTSQQAADVLNVSRPHVVKLARHGVLPHRMVGNRHRFLASDVRAYRHREAARGRRSWPASRRTAATPPRISVRVPPPNLARPVAVLDASVLVPAGLRDLPLSCADAEVWAARTRSGDPAQRDPASGATRGRSGRRNDQQSEGSTAAVAAGTNHLVTANLRDFPVASRPLASWCGLRTGSCWIVFTERSWRPAACGLRSRRRPADMPVPPKRRAGSRSWWRAVSSCPGFGAALLDTMRRQSRTGFANERSQAPCGMPDRALSSECVPPGPSGAGFLRSSGYQPTGRRIFGPMAGGSWQPEKSAAVS